MEIARKGAVVSAKAYGDVDNQRVTINTPMLLHSAMKALIGLQLAMYVDRDILRLNEPIGNHLPDFNVPADRNLTFRPGHVHATGIHFLWELAVSRLRWFSRPTPERHRATMSHRLSTSGKTQADHPSECCQDHSPLSHPVHLNRSYHRSHSIEVCGASKESRERMKSASLSH